MAVCAALYCFTQSGTVRANPTLGSPGDVPTSQTSERTGIRDFASGVRIDWKNLTVELAAEVAMREGPLELLACSPQTKEHESILIVRARPLHVFQAMGLIGLESGSPVRFDEGMQRRIPATGESLDLRIRCETPFPKNEVSATSWVVESGSEKPPAKLDWIFSGSRSDAGGRFGADLEGTVVCLVDFDNALISLATPHSADNEVLWLKANTEAIPPRGTRCTLLVRSAFCRTTEVRIGANGSLHLNDKPVSVAELLSELRPRAGDDRPVRLLIRLAEMTSKNSGETVQKAIMSKGFDGVIEIRRSGRGSARTSSPERGP